MTDAKRAAASGTKLTLTGPDAGPTRRRWQTKLAPRCCLYLHLKCNFIEVRVRHPAATIRQMVRWLANNIGLMILAVLLAFAVWLVSAWQEDPIIQDNLQARVIVTGLSQNGDTVLASTVPTSVLTIVRAPRSTLNQLADGGLRVNVNLADLEEGDHVIDLVPTLGDQPAVVVASRPLTTLVTIEKLARQTMQVSLNIAGSPAIGFSAQAAVIEPRSVTITATKQVITNVASVGGSLSIEGVRTGIDQSIRLFPRDANGNIVNNVLVEPSTVTVRLPVEQLSNYKDLAVKVETVGQPANGYAVTGISSNPSVVTVFGARDVITALQGFIATQPVSMLNAIQDVNERVSLNVPSNVSLLSGLQVSVTIKIEPIQGARTVVRNIEVIGLSTGVSSTVSPQTVDLVLTGSLPRLNSLTDEDVRVIVDAKDLNIGTNQVEAQVTLPDGISVQSMQPATIQVDLATSILASATVSATNPSDPTAIPTLLPATRPAAQTPSPTAQR